MLHVCSSASTRVRWIARATAALLIALTTATVLAADTRPLAFPGAQPVDRAGRGVLGCDPMTAEAWAGLVFGGLITLGVWVTLWLGWRDYDRRDDR